VALDLEAHVLPDLAREFVLVVVVEAEEELAEAEEDLCHASLTIFQQEETDHKKE